MDIVFEAALAAKDREAVRDALIAFNASQTPYVGPMEEIGFLIKDEMTGVVEGGLTGYMAYGWLFVELLFVPARYRGQGLGKQMMERAERLARDKNQIGIFLDTFEFQARGFYEKLGFEVFGSLSDFPPGSTRYFMRKQFQASAEGR